MIYVYANELSPGKDWIYEWNKTAMPGTYCNPVVFQLIGLIFRATKLDIFIDAPSCCAASLGLAAYGLLAVICL